MGGGRKSQTVGYKYYLGMHMVLCHGPVDKITRIRVDERDVWSGSRSGGSISLYKPDLFGGESREGGVSGVVDIMMGEPTQDVNSYLLGQLKNYVPAFRGVVSAVLRQCYVGMNPYLKPWDFRLTRVMIRQDGIPQWYPETAPIPVANGFEVRQRILFSLDVSGSMNTVVGNGVTRLDLMKQNMIRVLDELGYMAQDVGANGIAIDVGVTTLNGGGLFYQAVTAANIASLKSYVNGITASGGTAFRTTFQTAKSWFSATASERRNALVIITDGVPDPAGDFPDAVAEAAPLLNRTGAWSGNNAVDCYVVNIDLDNTSYSSQLDNTSGDGVPVVSGASSNELYNAVFAAFMGDTVALNVVHAIRECLTDPVWGMGLSEAEIDDVTFRKAAKTLRDERLGVCFIWDRQKTIQEIVQELLKHANAALYVDRRSGLFTIKLVRDDYDVANLVHLDETNIQKIENFSRRAFGELATAVTVNYESAMTSRSASIRIEDTALASMQMSRVETTLQYPCYPDATMAGRAAERQLRLLSSMLASCTIYASRAAASLTIGDPVKVSWEDHHLSEAVFRVTDIAYGDGKTNRIKLSVTEDVFASPAEQLVVPSPPIWDNPAAEPKQVTALHAIEAPYIELVQLNGQEYVDQAQAAKPDAGRVAAAAIAPEGPVALNARMYTNAGLGFEDIGTIDFAPGGYLASAVGKFDTTFTLDPTRLSDMDALELPATGQLGDELVFITAHAGAVFTVMRGVWDTVPQSHPEGEVLIIWDRWLTVADTEFSISESIQVKAQAVNGSGAAPLVEALTETVLIQGRASRPYRPGDVRVNGVADVDPNDYLAYPATITWKHRNRIQETAGVPISWTAASLAPEPDTEYRLKMYGITSANLVTPGPIIDVGAVTSYVLDLSSLVIPDGALTLRVEVYSVRNGLESFQAFAHTLPLLTPPSIVTLEAGAVFAPDQLSANQLEN